MKFNKTKNDKNTLNRRNDCIQELIIILKQYKHELQV